ncbi:hypothetical protein NLM33_42205 [Bradyrhizobium sp. CCGUVB1N3]|uniref:hypothetical protein n=1 Tax=Bradyrhizobium sp. CCGUVB1N3 TaxID=2949629 RepID=UPI0020B2F5FB|nr:hypothetical protein [Bradyrhizobium sp. CCGUVB1N3]MCP3476774.1 hypothetical protein [Bradyrhizobium sp. CCGUVB1N3]
MSAIVTKQPPNTNFHYPGGGDASEALLPNTFMLVARKLRKQALPLPLSIALALLAVTGWYGFYYSIIDLELTSMDELHLPATHSSKALGGSCRFKSHPSNLRISDLPQRV